MKTLRLPTVMMVIIMLAGLAVTVNGQGMRGSGRGGFEQGCDGPRMNGPADRPGRQGGMHGRHRQGPAVPPPELLKELGATDAQLESLETLEYAHRTTVIDLRSRLEKAELELDRLTRDAGTSEKDLLKAADTVITARGNLFKQNVSVRYTVRKILGEELFGKLQTTRKPGRQGPEARDGQGRRPKRDGRFRGAPRDEPAGFDTPEDMD